MSILRKWLYHDKPYRYVINELMSKDHLVIAHAQIERTLSIVFQFCPAKICSRKYYSIKNQRNCVELLHILKTKSNESNTWISKWWKLKMPSIEVFEFIVGTTEIQLFDELMRNGIFIKNTRQSFWKEFYFNNHFKVNHFYIFGTINLKNIQTKCSVYFHELVIHWRTNQCSWNNEYSLLTFSDKNDTMQLIFCKK